MGAASTEVVSRDAAWTLSVDRLIVRAETFPLLSDISFQVSAGEVLAIVGPNGAGKSTLIKAIACQQKSFEGRIQLHGSDIQSWDQSNLARHMAVLPQSSLLTFPFTGREVVELARTPHDTGAKEDARIVDEAIDYLDVVHLQDRLYTNMSGGEQQRIQLARVLAQIWQPVESARLLLLDEPSAYFDLAHQKLLVGLVRKLAKKGISVIVVLHDLNLALSCADRMAVISRGCLHRIGVAEDVLDQKCINDVFGVDARFLNDEETGRRHLVLAP